MTPQAEAKYRERRERIAKVALAGMLANPEWRAQPLDVAGDAVRQADALIEMLDRIPIPTPPAPEPKTVGPVSEPRGTPTRAYGGLTDAAVEFARERGVVLSTAKQRVREASAQGRIRTHKLSGRASRYCLEDVIALAQGRHRAPEAR